MSSKILQYIISVIFIHMFLQFSKWSLVKFAIRFTFRMWTRWFNSASWWSAAQISLSLNVTNSNSWAGLQTHKHSDGEGSTTTVCNTDSVSSTAVVSVVSVVFTRLWGTQTELLAGRGRHMLLSRFLRRRENDLPPVYHEAPPLPHLCTERNTQL